MSYKPELVARIKGALRTGLGPKLISSLTGIPQQTIQEWSVEDTRANVAADERVGDDIRDALLGRFMGSETTR